MKKYIGVKVIEAEPMDLIDAEEKLQRKIKPGNESGYFVEYEDGYKSWSPKNTFEEAYRRIDNLTFGLAIEAIKKGYRITRKGWDNPNIWIELQVPDKYSKMTKPYLYMVKNNDKFPIDLSCESILAEDWMIVE